MTARTRIKVCGITTPDDAAMAIDAGADAIGFVFVEDSPRYIDPDDAAAILDALPPFVTGVGVTRDLSVDDFSELEFRCPCPVMQLHGKENEKTVTACGPCIKAFKYDPATIRSQLDRWEKVEAVDALLIDGSDGGQGETLDWHALADHLGDDYDKLIILAGGLHPNNVAEAIRAVRPWAVDVSSGVESAPGAKDPDKLAAFVRSVREADASWWGRLPAGQSAAGRRPRWPGSPSRDWWHMPPACARPQDEHNLICMRPAIPAQPPRPPSCWSSPRWRPASPPCSSAAAGPASPSPPPSSSPARPTPRPSIIADGPAPAAAASPPSPRPRTP
jgi:phosphoribosylanthranilate isomerase